MQYLPSGHLERDDSVIDSLLNSTPVYRLCSILRMNLDSVTGSVVQVLCQDIPRQDIFSKDISSLSLNYTVSTDDEICPLQQESNAHYLHINYSFRHP